MSNYMPEEIDVKQVMGIIEGERRRRGLRNEYGKEIHNKRNNKKYNRRETMMELKELYRDRREVQYKWTEREE